MAEGMRIEDFKSALVNGYRPNLFKMEILGLPEKFTFMCKGTQLPGKTIGIVEAPYLGMKNKLGGDVVFEDLTVTVLMDTDFDVRSKIELWMETIKANEAALGLESALYKRLASLITLDTQGEEIASYSFVGIWPNTMAAIDLAYDTNDVIAEYTITFSYDYWTRLF